MGKDIPLQQSRLVISGQWPVKSTYDHSQVIIWNCLLLYYDFCSSYGNCRCYRTNLITNGSYTPSPRHLTLHQIIKGQPFLPIEKLSLQETCLPSFLFHSNSSLYVVTHEQTYVYGTTHMQVDGLACVLALVLKYLRTNTRVEKVNAPHKHNITAHVMNLNR